VLVEISSIKRKIKLEYVTLSSKKRFFWVLTTGLCIELEHSIQFNGSLVRGMVKTATNQNGYDRVQSKRINLIS